MTVIVLTIKVNLKLNVGGGRGGTKQTNRKRKKRGGGGGNNVMNITAEAEWYH